MIGVIYFLEMYKRINRYSYKNGKKKFIVNKISDESDESAFKTLVSLSSKKDKLMMILEREKSKPEVKRLLNKRNVEIEELNSFYNNKAAYSINKGDKIGICIRNNKKIEDENTMFFVLLHELAHIMTISYGHTEEFWKNFKFLLKVSIQNNLYIYENYNKNTKHFCTVAITSTPLNE